MTKHLSYEQLLRHLDGELSRLAAWRAAAHLKSCWACQAELDHLKEQITDIVDAQSAVFEPSLPPPPGPWPSLEPRLERQAARADRASSLWRKAAPFSGRSFRAQLAYGSAALALLAIGLSNWFSVQPVHAKEVLERVAAADGGRLAITERRVARQRVRVAKTSGASPAKLARLDAWRSPKSTYWDAGDPIGAELQARYRSNGLEANLPLSPEAMETWVRMAGEKPSASQEQGFIKVEVAATSEGRAQGLEGVSLHVRAENWHLDEMTLAFGDATYRISEEESSVIARADVPRDVMAHLEPSGPVSIPVAESPAASGPAGGHADLDAVEMSVRSELHRIGADLLGAVEIVPQPHERLRVEVRQVPPATKETLVALLGNRPGVQLEFPSLDGSKTAGARVTRVIPQAGGPRASADPRVSEFFGSAEAQESYTQAVFETSNSMLAHLHALRELAERWNEDREKGLSPGARTSLHAMVRDHASAVRAASSGMRTQLAPLLGHFGIPMTERAPTAQTGTSWQAASRTTLDTVRRVDQTLRALLTTSDSPLPADQALPRLRQGLGELQEAVIRP